MNAIADVTGGRAISLLTPNAARMDQLGAWFAAEYPSLLRFAYLVSGDRAAAEDLVQETFVRMWRAAGRIEDATAGAYARTTLVNLARSGFRRRAIERRASRAERDVAAEAADVGARDEVWRAILTLSPRQRAVVALRYYEDLSERDVATTLGMSVGAVKKHSDRAMTKLREILGGRS